MITCPKCGGMNISGPTYGRSLLTGHEWLQYECLTCGYYRNEPTKDAPSIDGTRGLKGVFEETP